MIRWTEADLAALQKRRSLVSPAGDLPPPPLKSPARSDGDSGHLALGRLPAGKMNALEAAYSNHLWQLQCAGEILWYRYEAIRLRLADGAMFTPDFMVLPASGILEARETKGFMREAGRVRLLVAASMYPFRFILVRKKGSGWSEEVVSA
jgi:hypothetical protein